jgi:multiple sugar transport system substrate-binding protein
MNNTFQVVLLGVFILFGLVGVGLFATGSLERSDSERTPMSFTIWGEWEERTFDGLLDASGIADDEFITVSYRAVSGGNLEERLVNALARGEGPDVLLIPHTKLLALSDLITTVGTQFYPARQFQNTFIEGSEVFLSPSGITAIPLAVDPLVMYWNRDILTEAGFVSPPSEWGEVPQYARTITRADDAGSISRAGIALGTADNIASVKEILSSLFFQVNNQIVSRVERGYKSVLDQANTGDVSSAQSALGLYTQYADPTTAAYSWNNSFSSAERAFSAGNLGLYLAPASDITAIRAQNPNLNFDVAQIPQLTDGQPRTYGTVYGFAILKRASNQAGILAALSQLTNQAMAQAITDQTAFVPARKDSLAGGADNAYQQVFFDAAIIARGWLDPDSAATEEIFKEMVRAVTSGRADRRGAINQADVALTNLLKLLNE